MQIFGPFRVSTPQPASVSRSSSPAPSSAVSRTSQPVDELDLSPDVQHVERAAAADASSVVEGIRFDRVAEIRQQIADGSYETPEKLDFALDRLLDEVG